MNEMEIEILVTKILTDENADTIVAKVNREYASSSYENASRLIDSIPVIVREAMKHFEKLNATIHRGLWASVMLPTIDVENKRTRFAVLTPIVMAICPNGTDIGCSATEKDLFNEWKELLLDKKVFSWGKDESWADSLGYTDYIKMAEVD